MVGAAAITGEDGGVDAALVAAKDWGSGDTGSGAGARPSMASSNTLQTRAAAT
jgi:hypothetical protein